MAAKLIGTLTLGLLALGALAPAALPAADNATRVWRAQLEVQVCDVEHAGTDDGVKVQLNPYNVTWLDYPRDDFKRADAFTYDLRLDNVSRVGEIGDLVISKGGSDGLCLLRVALLINGRLIYERAFGTSGVWLDSGSPDTRTYVIPSLVMRYHPLWVSYVSPLPSPIIPRSELESRIAAEVGTAIHGNPAYWGHLNGRGVEVSRKDITAVHVDLDLAIKCENDWGDGGCADPAVDVDVDVRFTCQGGALTLTTESLDVDVEFGWYLQWLVDLMEAMDTMPDLSGMQFTTSVGVPVCPTITVDADGDVVFSLPPPAPLPQTAPAPSPLTVRTR